VIATTTIAIIRITADPSVIHPVTVVRISISIVGIIPIATMTAIRRVTPSKSTTEHEEGNDYHQNPCALFHHTSPALKLRILR